MIYIISIKFCILFYRVCYFCYNNFKTYFFEIWIYYLLNIINIANIYNYKYKNNLVVYHYL